MIKEAIILAGGFGTRLQSVVSDLPKPMAPINNIPFLNYQLNYLKHFGVKHVVLSVGHLADKIQDYYKTSFNGISVSYTKELSAMGTGGGIRLALEKCDDKQAIVLNGDSFFDINLKDFYHLHYIHESDFSIAGRKVEEAGRYGTIKLGKFFLPSYNGDDSRNFYRAEAFQEKSEKNEAGIINGGIYILNKKQFFKHTKPAHAFSIEKDFFEKQTQKLDIGVYLSDGYFIDIGIPEDYTKAQHDLKEFKYR